MAETRAIAITSYFLGPRHRDRTSARSARARQLQQRRCADIAAETRLTPICLILLWSHSSAMEHDPGIRV